MSKQNKELINEFAPQTNKEEDITKKIEIGKDITPEIQNSIFDPLLNSDNINQNETSSDNEAPTLNSDFSAFSDYSDPNFP